MRYCPFCSAENLHETSQCGSCGRRLPPQAPRRRKSGESTETVPTANLATEIARVKPQKSRRPVPKRQRSTTASSSSEWPAAPTAPTPHPDNWDVARTTQYDSNATSTAAREQDSWGAATRANTNQPEFAVALPSKGPRSRAGQDTASSVVSSAIPAPMPSEQTSVHTQDLVPAPPAPSESREQPAVLEQPITSEPSQSYPVAVRDSAVPQIAPFKPPETAPIPNVPESGLLPALKYSITFARARWQRRGVIRILEDEIRNDTGVLDGILGALGKQARALGVRAASLDAENHSIDDAERRRKVADHECAELSNRQAEENSRFAESEAERQGKLNDAQDALEQSRADLTVQVGVRRSLREQYKSLEAQQKGLRKSADNSDAEAAKQDTSDAAARFRKEECHRAAEKFRYDANLLEPEKAQIQQQLDAVEHPISAINSRIVALKSDLDANKRALIDLREGHRHRLAEIEAEQGRKTRELAQADSEIQRRLVTLGTLVNLNRLPRQEFSDLYEQIDRLRGGIGARSNEIDKLAAERQAFDKASLIRGVGTLFGGVVLFLAFLAIVIAIF